MEPYRTPYPGVESTVYEGLVSTPAKARDCEIVGVRVTKETTGYAVFFVHVHNDATVSLSMTTDGDSSPGWYPKTAAGRAAAVERAVALALRTRDHFDMTHELGAYEK